MKNNISAVALSTIFAALSIVSFPSLSFADEAAKSIPAPVTVFEKYHEAFINAKTYEDVLPFMVQKVVKEMKATPADERKMMFGFLQSMAPKKINVVSTKIEGDVATLKLAIVIPAGKGEDKGLFGNSMKEETTGEVRMVVENGEWKVEKEKWNTKMTSDETPPPAPTAEAPTTPLSPVSEGVSKP